MSKNKVICSAAYTVKAEAEAAKPDDRRLKLWTVNWLGGVAYFVWADNAYRALKIVAGQMGVTVEGGGKAAPLATPEAVARALAKMTPAQKKDVLKLSKELGEAKGEEGGAK